MAMRVMVFGGELSRTERISRWDGVEDGVKRGEMGEGLVGAVEERRVSGGGRSKRCCHVEEGLE